VNLFSTAFGLYGYRIDHSSSFKHHALKPAILVSDLKSSCLACLDFFFNSSVTNMGL
jgi:hypothetical protein